VDAILVGIGTVLADNPSLTARPSGGKGRDPLRIILDSSLKIPLTAKALNVGSQADTILATTRRSNPKRRADVAAKGAEVLVLRGVREGVSLPHLLSVLGRRGIVSLLIEGGGRVSAGALRAGVVNKVIYYLAPILIGGQQAPGAIGGEGVQRLDDAFRLRDVRTSQLGHDLLVEAYIDGGGSSRRVYRNH
jgi:diaminohydroxyphosphoribosylaminopyrimidine deaminase/5-amino-6-(5-phosphoribosylamino)uracil reductase